MNDDEKTFDFLKPYNIKNFNKPIIEVKDFMDDKYVNIRCTQLFIDKKIEKRILIEWLEFLPQIKSEYLHFDCHVPQKMLDIVFQLKQLKYLYIKWTNSKEISNIQNLKELEYFHLGSAAQLEDLTPITELKKLVVLEIDNTQKIYDYYFLSKLENLISLSIEGGFYKQLKIKSLNPLENLINLRHLKMPAVKIDEFDIESVLKLKKLVTLFLPVNYKKEDLIKIKTELTDLIYGPEYYDSIYKENMRKIKNITS